MLYDVCVIGGGASGLAAAVAAGREGASVLILERLDKTGKKLLATGNGKCNLSNADILRPHIPAEAYRCGQRYFPVKVLNAFDASDTLAFFESMGLYTRRRDAYIYPLSEQAAAVADALRWQLEQQKACVITGEEAKTIERVKASKGQAHFLVVTETSRYTCRRLILSTGGQSSGKLGSNGSGYALCRQMGHRVTETVPALCGLHCAEKYFRELAGIRLQGRITLLVDGRRVSEDAGELQLTAYGLSGIPVFQVSRYAACGLAKHRDVRAVLDLMPEWSREELYQRLRQQAERHPGRDMAMLLSGMMHKKLAACLLRHGLPNRPDRHGRRLTELPEREACFRELASLIKHLEVHVTGTNGFEQSQVTAGGVDTREIDADSLSSRLVKGLYITGELLDVDGICGGYNLQWAWATGVLAGTHAGRSCHD